MKLIFSLEGFVNKQNWHILGTENIYVVVPPSLSRTQTHGFCHHFLQRTHWILFWRQTIAATLYGDILCRFVAIQNALVPLKAANVCLNETVHLWCMWKHSGCNINTDFCDLCSQTALCCCCKCWIYWKYHYLVFENFSATCSYSIFFLLSRAICWQTFKLSLKILCYWKFTGFPKDVFLSLFDFPYLIFNIHSSLLRHSVYLAYHFLHAFSILICAVVMIPRRSASLI